MQKGSRVPSRIKNTKKRGGSDEEQTGAVYEGKRIPFLPDITRKYRRFLQILAGGLSCGSGSGSRAQGHDA